MSLNITGASKSYFGAVDSPYYFLINDETIEYYGVSFGGISTTNPASPQGLYTISTTANTSQNLYKNGTLRYSSGGNPVGNINSTIYIGAGHTAGDAYSYNNNQYSFFTTGFGLNNTQQAALSTIINTFQTTLGRNTY